MAENTITSDILLAALNDKIVSETFDIVRSNRTGILQLARMMAPQRAYEGSKMSWLNMRVGATADATTAEVAVAATTIPVTDGSKFRAGMMISSPVGDEILLVTAVSGNNLTVLRAIAGTDSTIPSGSVLTIDSVGREENSLAENDGIFQPTEAENYFQTMDTAVEMSRRALATLQFGNTNDLAFQLNERMMQLAIQMDRALIGGVKTEQTIAGKKHTYTGGLRYWLSQGDALNVDNAGAALTLQKINDLTAEIVTRGGTADTIAVGIKKARLLNDLVAANYSSQRLNDFVSDSGALTRLPSDLPLIGTVTQIVIDTNLRDDELMVFDSSMIGIKPMAAGNDRNDGNWRRVDATQPGQDGARVRIIGDFGFEIRNNETHFARLSNIG